MTLYSKNLCVTFPKQSNAVLGKSHLLHADIAEHIFVLVWYQNEKQLLSYWRPEFGSAYAV